MEPCPAVLRPPRDRAATQPLPFTAQCSCIAMLNADTARARSCSPPRITKTPRTTPDRSSSSRAWMKWNYHRVLGRREALPSISSPSTATVSSAFRLLAFGRAERADQPQRWLGYRFQTEPHCDLPPTVDLLRCQRPGRRRAADSTWISTATFAIESPKSQGVTQRRGRAGGPGRFREIAEYCLRDVRPRCSCTRFGRTGLAASSEHQAVKTASTC